MVASTRRNSHEFRCRWDWCTATLASHDALRAHFAAEHEPALAPVTRREAAAMNAMSMGLLSDGDDSMCEWRGGCMRVNGTDKACVVRVLSAVRRKASGSPHTTRSTMSPARAMASLGAPSSSSPFLPDPTRPLQLTTTPGRHVELSRACPLPELWPASAGTAQARSRNPIAPPPSHRNPLASLHRISLLGRQEEREWLYPRLRQQGALAGTVQARPTTSSPSNHSPPASPHKTATRSRHHERECRHPQLQRLARTTQARPTTCSPSLRPKDRPLPTTYSPSTHNRNTPRLFRAPRPRPRPHPAHRPTRATPSRFKSRSPRRSFRPRPRRCAHPHH
jgi:hypothetical protein